MSPIISGPTLNDYKAILSYHVAQSSCFNWMVEKKEIFIWQNISKNPNDATCHILRLPCVNILVCTIVTSVIANVVARIHPWIRIKFPYLYFIKKIHLLFATNGRLRLMVICNLSFATMLIFSHCVACN
jgi:hypothetical protein